MDFDDWEYLSDEHNGDVKGFISIDMDYFHKLMDPPKELHEGPIEAPIPEGDRFSLPQFADMKLDSPNSHTPGREASDCEHDNTVFVACKEDDEDTIDEFADMKFEEGFDCKDDKGGFGGSKEDDRNQFAEMKLGSPTPQTEVGRPEFEEKEEGKNGGGLSIWKVGITRFGALCSFGVVFATICVIALGSRNRGRHQDQNLHFQMYTHDRRFKQAVHHATRLNGAISVARGAPLSRAHISIGGYFEGL